MLTIINKGYIKIYQKNIIINKKSLIFFWFYQGSLSKTRERNKFVN